MELFYVKLTMGMGCGLGKYLWDGDNFTRTDGVATSSPCVNLYSRRYQVAVVALDRGTPPKSGSILVDISVADVNDNAPLFDNETYEV